MGFPAHAGMDPRAREHQPCRRGLPRTRGDGPRRTGDPAGPLPASPHTRGWTRIDQAGDLGLRGFPAHAGMDPGTVTATRCSFGLPRTRGDGPRLARRRRRRRTASPHTRGWTLPQAPPAKVERGFPAHAGMDPFHRVDQAEQPRLPRTRGDGPFFAFDSPPGDEASPHTRGWTPSVPSAAERRAGFPAHAGMDPTGPSWAGSRSGLPRTRGDGPEALSPASRPRAASPHTRGWTAAAEIRRGVNAGFPAHAGMDPRPAAPPRRASGLPRTRGDGPAREAAAAEEAAASPHTRGWTRRAEAGQPPAGGFPAHAGMDHPRPPLPDGDRGLPRTRGDGPRRSARGARPGRASPHTRGWTASRRPDWTFPRGFPAHAGMDPDPAAGRGNGGRLPRTRGDGPPPAARPPRRCRASPHTRGWTTSSRGVVTLDTGFPAHAGMDRTRAAPGRRRRRLPRTRGDGPLDRCCCCPDPEGFPAHAGMDLRSKRRRAMRRRLPRTRGDGPRERGVRVPPSPASPHTRGWTSDLPAAGAPDRGFPAHAGMDLRLAPPPQRLIRLPRTRGDGPASRGAAPPPAGASPHTRGWTAVLIDPPALARGFPAHAGMDPRPAARPDRPRLASPHTRGWTACRNWQTRRRRGFPAHAGMDRARTASRRSL